VKGCQQFSKCLHSGWNRNGGFAPHSPTSLLETSPPPPPGMNQDLKGRRFADIAEIQWESLVALDSFSMEDFRQCFQQWEWRWDQCIQSQGSTLMGIKFQTCMNILNKIF
jgi:hypothetical protein